MFEIITPNFELLLKSCILKEYDGLLLGSVTVGVEYYKAEKTVCTHSEAGPDSLSKLEVHKVLATVSPCLS